MDDFNKDTKDQVVDLLNVNNTLPIPITKENILLSESNSVDQSGLVEVALRGVQDRGYRKTPMRVRYHRIDLGKLFGGSYTPEVICLSQSSLYSLLPRFNAILGTRFIEDDVEDIDLIPHGNDVVVEMTIVAKDTSKFYHGSFKITFNRRWLLLEEVIDPYLDIFKHPDPIVPGRTSVGLLTWGMDFTLIMDKMTVDPTAAQYRGAFADMEGFRNALSENYGIWGWPDNRDSTNIDSKIVDYDTRDVERANENFQRVVIHSNIRQSDYVGTAYFHYNLP